MNDTTIGKTPITENERWKWLQRTLKKLSSDVAYSDPSCAIGDLETAVMKKLDVLEAKLDELLQRPSP